MDQMNQTNENKPKTSLVGRSFTCVVMFFAGMITSWMTDDEKAFWENPYAAVYELRSLLTEISQSEDIPESLRWHLYRIDGTALDGTAYGLAFMEVAAELLPENDCEAIHSLARERVDAMRRELREAATPTIPPSLQEKLNQREGRDAD